MASVLGFDKSRKKRCVCGRCAAIVEYTAGEVKERHGIDHGGGSDGHKWIGCPNCNKPIILGSW